MCNRGSIHLFLAFFVFPFPRITNCIQNNIITLGHEISMTVIVLHIIIALHSRRVVRSVENHKFCNWNGQNSICVSVRHEF